MPAQDLTNQRFGSLTVISFSHHGNDCQFFHKCQCDCGEIFLVRQGSLLRGEATRCKKCAHLTRRKFLPSFKQGDRIGNWTIQGDDPSNRKYIFADCDCGKNQKISKELFLLSELPNCRRCVATIHGQGSNVYRKYLYSLWRNIKSRIFNPKVSGYKYYGERGIKMHPSWVESFETFQKDILSEIGPRPSPKHSLDRINNDIGYELGNVKWSSTLEQVLNRSISYLHDGEPFNLSEFSERIKVRKQTVKKLFGFGYSVGDIERYSKLPQNKKTIIGMSINKGIRVSIEEVEKLPLIKKSTYQRPPFYNTHHSIKQRCYNPKNKDYASYGGRGIDVYLPWHDLDVFSKDIIRLIGEKPSPNHTLDRIDTNMGYYPDNVRWANVGEQAKNKNSATRLSGIVISAEEMAKQYGINRDSIIKLCRLGFNQEGISFYAGLTFKEKKELRILKSQLSQKEALEKYTEMKIGDSSLCLNYAKNKSNQLLNCPAPIASQTFSNL